MNIVNNKLRITLDDITNLYECGQAIKYVELDEDPRGNIVVHIVGNADSIKQHKAFKASWKPAAYGYRVSRIFRKKGTPIDMFN